jgi:Trk-type K+ transport system membrane component
VTAKGINPVEPLPSIAIAGSPALSVPGMVWIALVVYLISMLAGWATFMLVPDIRVGGNEFSHDRAIFLALNCGTLTGFNTTVGVGDFNPDNNVGPITAILLAVVGVLATLIMSGLAAVRVLRLPYRDAQVIWTAVMATVLAVLIGTIALGIGATTGSFGLTNGIFQAVCAFGNCGLVLGRVGDLAGWRLHLVLLPLATAGGLGLPVLMELYDRAVKRRPMGRHSTTTIAALAAVYLIGMAGALFFLWPDAADKTGLRETIAKASALSLDTRTLGFPVPIDTLTRPGQWWLVLLMIVGAGSAGTAGGLKVTNLLEISGGIWRSLRGLNAGKTFGIAFTWLGSYSVIAAVCWMLLLHTEPQIPADRLAFLAVSAASNVGLSADTVSIVGPGLYVLGVAMLLGRLAPIAILWWMARATPEAELLVA